jgi:signal transduction histidine kinase
LVVVVLALLNFVLAVWYVIRTGLTASFFTHQLFLPFLAIAYTALSVAIISRRPRNPIGYIFLSVGTLFLLIGLAASVIDDYWMVLPFSTSALIDPAIWLGNWTWLPAQMLPLTFVFLLFPDGHLPSRRWRWIGWAAGVGLFLTALGLAALPGPLPEWGTTANPYGLAGAEDLIAVMMNIGGALLAVGFAGSIAALIMRFRRSRGIERAQIKWLVYAGIVVLVLAVLMVPLWVSGNLNDRLAMELSIILTNLMTLGIAVAATVAIIRYRLYEVDIIINRTLVYGVMTGVILLIYSLIVGAAGLLFGSQGSWLLTLLATGLVAVLFQPILIRLQRGVNRLLYGQRDEPFTVLAQLGQRLEQTVTPESIYPTIVKTLAQALKLPYVALQVRDGEDFKTVESTGRTVTEPVLVPLTNQGEVVGRLLVGRRMPNEEFSEADQQILQNVARQAGAAVHNAHLTADLRRSRQQIVTTREEERRRLRRDLHDGLGPALASLLLEARVLRRLVRDDPPAAEALAVDMQADIKSTIDDIRRVVNELRPPALDDLGLVAALHVMATKIGESGSDGNEGSRPDGPLSRDGRLRINIDAPEDLPPLPAAVEVAAYRIIQEALTNVIHHAEAGCAVVRLRLAGDLCLEIADDGVGFNSGRDGGVGLHSMRERAVELSGSCRIDRRPEGGTIVRATLPLGAG